jgi:hypothetical protein
MDRQPNTPADSIEHILEADRAAREFVRAAAAKGATSGK